MEVSLALRYRRGVANRGSIRPVSYADAIDISAPAVANVYARKLQQSVDPTNPANNRAQLKTSIGSAVVVDSNGYLVTNYHVVAGATEIRIQLADGRIANPQYVGDDRPRRVSTSPLTLTSPDWMRPLAWPPVSTSP